MTDIRAALEDAVRILSGGHPGYVGDHSIRTVQVRQDTVDRLRAALAAASPESERCQCDIVGDGMPSCPAHRRAPAAPTVKALREALVKDAVAAYQVDAVGRFIYDPPTFRDRLIGLEAAARADERTRLTEQRR